MQGTLAMICPSIHPDHREVLPLHVSAAPVLAVRRRSRDKGDPIAVQNRHLVETALDGVHPTHYLMYGDAFTDIFLRGLYKSLYQDDVRRDLEKRILL